MRKLWMGLLLAVGLGFFTYFLIKLPWHDAILALTQSNPKYLFLYLGTSLLIKFFLGWRWYVILKAKNIKVPYWDAVAYRFASAAVSFVTPGPRVGGEAVAAAMARRHQTKKHPVSFAKALSTVLIDRAVEVQTFAALFFVGVLILAILGDIPGVLRYFLLGASAILLVVIVLLAINVAYGKPFLVLIARKLSKNPTFQKQLGEFEHTLVTFYKEDRKEFIISHLVSSIAWLVSLLEYKYLLAMLGYDAPLYAIFLVYSFVGIAYAIPIPLAIGSLEGLQAAAFSILGLSTALGVVLALLTRLRDIVFTIIGFMILVYYGFTPRKAAATIR